MYLVCNQVSDAGVQGSIEVSANLCVKAYVRASRKVRCTSEWCIPKLNIEPAIHVGVTRILSRHVQKANTEHSLSWSLVMIFNLAVESW